jgi:ubiquinone/menaquinone biosynthesis C-methylase UbiE
MKKNPELLSFRYNKLFLFNRFKYKKIESKYKSLIMDSHSFCPICFYKEASLISEVDRDGYPCEIVVCMKCNFVFNNSFMVNPIDYYANQYGKDSWGEPEKSFIKRISSDSPSLKRFEFIKKQLGVNFPYISRILEIGCGDGCNLLPYHLIGKNVLGCDFNDNFLVPGRMRGMKLIKANITEIDEYPKFDLIMLIHTFSHVISMDEMVKQVYSRLNPGGLVFIEAPGIINWNRTKKAKKSSTWLRSSNNFMGFLQFNINYYFDLEHLKYIWERNNFEMVVGDEWVRAIFKRKDERNSNDLDLKPKLNEFNYKIIKHLKDVERDFLSLPNLIRGFMKLIYRKFF